MELTEPETHLRTLMPMNFLYTCRYPTTIFREISVLEPFDKLAKLEDDWNDLVVWSGFKKFAECLQDEFFRCTRTLGLYLLLRLSSYLPPRLLG